MQRRTFITQSGLVAVGLATYGNIRWTGESYVGDTPTTTDILGPFYRPGAPLRTNLNPKNYDGHVLQLMGTVYQHEGEKPVQGCRVEIWQCQSDGWYDNLSDDYHYRGYMKTGTNGQYHFLTVQPPPEPTDETKAVYRPAHIHLRISAPGHQDLITQIYFKGDALLEEDPSTKSGLAINRILHVEKTGAKESRIRFDIVLQKQVLPDEKMIRSIVGVYKMSDGSLMEFYPDGGLLFYKINGQIWGGLSYSQNRTFTGANTNIKFEGEETRMKVLYRFVRRRRVELEGEKILNYQ